MDDTKTGRALPVSDVTQKSDALLDDYLKSVREQFTRALTSNGKPVKKHFTLCGSTIELIFANERLLPYITPALEHLSIVTDENPTIKICVWDDVTIDIDMPAPPWFGHAVQTNSGNIEGVYTHRGDIRGFNNKRIQAAFNWSANALSMYDRKKATGYDWTKDARDLPAYETSAPLRTILNWWLEERGFPFAHGAAVGTRHGGVLIAGKGGSGKSTAALACLNSGLLYISDDYCVVCAEPAPTVYSVFSSAKVDPGNIFRVGHIAPTRIKTGNVHDDKDVFFLHPQFAGQIAASLPLRAILLPRITGKADSALLPAPSTDCVKALTLSTMCQFPGAGKKAVDIFLKLAKALPGYYLDFGTDVTQVPKLISNLLEKKG